MASEPLPLITYLRPKLDPDALLGLPGEVATRVAAATGADEAAILLSTLTMLGSAAGPEPHVSYWGAEHPARLMTIIAGKTATGLKGTAVNAAQRLFEVADPRWARRIDGGVKSPEALIALVDDRGDDTRLLLLESEFSRLAQTMARTGEFSQRLRDAWDGKPMFNTTKKNPSHATHHHISLLGSITPEELEKHHRRLSQGGGLENRLLYVISAPDIGNDGDPFDAGLADFPDLVDRLRLTLDVSRKAVLDRTDPLSREIFLERGTGWQPSVVLPVDDAVRRGWKTLVRDRLPRADNEAIANLWARGPAQVVRLACAYAIGTASDSVTAEHVTAAVAAWRYCAESAEALFGIAAAPEDGGGDRAARRKVLEYLLKCAGKDGGWATQTQLNKTAFQGNAPRGGVARVLTYLVDKGYVEYRSTQTQGRPKHEYRLPPR